MTAVEFSEFARNLLLAVAAGVGAWLAWKRLSPVSDQAAASQLQADLASRQFLRELFRNAAADLGSSSLEVRLAAIYVLGEISRDYEELAEPAFEVVQAHVRLRADKYKDEEPPADVRAAFSMLRTRIVPDAD